MGADLPLSQMYAGGAAAGVAAEGIEPAAKKKKKQAGGGASALTGDDASLAGLTDTAEFLSQETTMLITTEEAVGEEVEEGLDRRIKPRAASSLPLVFGDKVLRSKVLLECEGDALDFSGDMGAVGRFSVCQGQAKDDEELLLDLKGVIYKTTIVPSNTFFLVNVGQTEAKVEAIMNDFVQLRADTDRNVNETMVEGTMEGFTFDSDGEGERPAAVVPGTEATGSKDAPDDDVDSGGDIKAVKKKKTPAKTLVAKAPAKQRAAGKSKTGRSKASAKDSNAKKAATKKAARPKTTKSAAAAGK
ncbi:unnamed protein product [Sphagnum troendelagicum]|uniref:DNA-binding protein BIN4 n=1 Tax=Sphagnum troendelagicum TaxID=128251 RepID=A0ABP0UTH1_9BRYO